LMVLISPVSATTCSRRRRQGAVRSPLRATQTCTYSASTRQRRAGLPAKSSETRAGRARRAHALERLELVGELGGRGLRRPLLRGYGLDLERPGPRRAAARPCCHAGTGESVQHCGKLCVNSKASLIAAANNSQMGCFRAQHLSSLLQQTVSGLFVSERAKLYLKNSTVTLGSRRGYTTRRASSWAQSCGVPLGHLDREALRRALGVICKRCGAAAGFSAVSIPVIVATVAAALSSQARLWRTAPHSLLYRLEQELATVCMPKAHSLPPSGQLRQAGRRGLRAQDNGAHACRQR